jgi:predicted dehydrogenase
MRWGIMGTGGIAASFAVALTAEGDELVAVGSGDPERARAFAERRGVAHHGAHHDVLDARPDVVYVATTNDRHHRDALACIEAGIPVLVEKPFALDLPRAEAVLAAARERGVFVMEAMWMLLQPAFAEARRRVEAGELGDVRLLTADFGVRLNDDPSRRWYAREQGGGALLDVGVYPLTLAIALLGEPTQVRALGETADTGVDVNLAVAMRHERGLSSWACSFVADSGVEATIAGTEGSLRIHGPFHHASRLTLRVVTEERSTVEVEGADLGLRHEVREVQRCLAEGLLESPVVPHAHTRSVMRWLDAVRAEVGVTFG